MKLAPAGATWWLAPRNWSSGSSVFGDATGKPSGPRVRLRTGLRSTPPQQFSRSEEHTSELQSLMRISYAVFCLKKKNDKHVLRLNTEKNTDCSSYKHHIYHHEYIAMS